MHYLKCYQDYGDIIKEAISKSRNLDQVTSAHTLVLALRKQYLKLLDLGRGTLDKSSADFTQLKVSFESLDSFLENWYFSVNSYFSNKISKCQLQVHLKPLK